VVCPLGSSGAKVFNLGEAMRFAGSIPGPSTRWTVGAQNGRQELANWFGVEKLLARRLTKSSDPEDMT
jgi:hypothetical protein